jgi:hypothetical protein
VADQLLDAQISGNVQSQNSKEVFWKIGSVDEQLHSNNAASRAATNAGACPLSANSPPACPDSILPAAHSTPHGTNDLIFSQSKIKDIQKPTRF